MNSARATASKVGTDGGATTTTATTTTTKKGLLLTHVTKLANPVTISRAKYRKHSYFPKTVADWGSGMISAASLESLWTFWP